MALANEQPVRYKEAVNFLSGFSSLIASSRIGEKGDWKPVRSGIRLSTQSILQLAEDLLVNSPFILTSRLSQDCLENLFSSIRLKNPVPSPLEFEHSLKLVTVVQFLRTATQGNYDQDDSEYLAEFLGKKPAESDDEDVEDDEELGLDVVMSEEVVCSFSSMRFLEICDAERTSLSSCWLLHLKLG